MPESGTDTHPDDNTASDLTQLPGPPPEPALSVVKIDVLAVDADGDDVPSPGDVIEYQITVVNDGTGDANGVVLRDEIPVYLTLLDASVQTSQGTVTALSPLTVELGEVVPGVAGTVSFRVLVDFDFPPEQTEVANQAMVTSLNHDPLVSDDPDTDPSGDATITAVFAALPEVSVDDVATGEATGQAVFTVLLSKATHRSVTVTYETADRGYGLPTAFAGIDYASIFGELEIAAGETSATVTVPVHDDVVLKEREQRPTRSSPCASRAPTCTT